MFYRTSYALWAVVLATSTSAVHADEPQPRAAQGKNLEVAIELMIVKTPEAKAERFRILANFESVKGRDGSLHVVASGLTAKQMRGWIEWLQEDQRTNVMQAPKVTLANEQSERIKLVDQIPIAKTQEVVKDGQFKVVPVTEMADVGLIYELRPVVSADRRSVRLDAKVTLSSVGQQLVPKKAVQSKANGEGRKLDYGYVAIEQALVKLCLDQILDIPVNTTAACCLGQTMTETRTEFGPPILSRLPYVNRLFRNVGYGREADSLFVFLTPHILESDD
ncbi:MAG: type II and III secretion system protein [Gemmataceae bacterium]|nr:type II and III secretion system protein [Gemmataceae bacterium]